MCMHSERQPNYIISPTAHCIVLTFNKNSYCAVIFHARVTFKSGRCKFVQLKCFILSRCIDETSGSPALSRLGILFLHHLRKFIPPAGICAAVQRACMDNNRPVQCVHARHAAVQATQLRISYSPCAAHSRVASETIAIFHILTEMIT